jgi:hypothetical protein
MMAEKDRRHLKNAAEVDLERVLQNTWTVMIT